MIKLDRPKILLINLLLIAGGVIFVLSGALGVQGTASAILLAIGTSLIATGGVNLLDRLFTESPKTSVSLVSLMRMTMDRRIHDKKDNAKVVEILGISLTECLCEINNDPKHEVVKHILTIPETRIRMMFIHPKARFLKQRYLEDNFPRLDDLLERQRQSMEACVELYHILCQFYKHEKDLDRNFEPKGSLAIKLIEACPYVSMERYDDQVYWGIYTSDTPGKKAPIFLTRQDDDPKLFDKFKKHFNALFDRGYEEVSKGENGASEDHNIVLRVGQNGVWLNTDLVANLLPA